jgi:hypothetical protein
MATERDRTREVTTKDSMASRNQENKATEFVGSKVNPACLTKFEESLAMKTCNKMVVFLFALIAVAGCAFHDRHPTNAETSSTNPGERGA